MYPVRLLERLLLLHGYPHQRLPCLYNGVPLIEDLKVHHILDHLNLTPVGHNHKGRIFIVLVRIQDLIVVKDHERLAGFTRSPAFTEWVDPLPSILTVSIPICIRISVPSSVVDTDRTIGHRCDLYEPVTGDIDKLRGRFQCKAPTRIEPEVLYALFQDRTKDQGVD